MRIELSIEELVLHGFPHRERYLISAAIERELTRLLAERGASQSFAHDREIDFLPGSTFHFGSGAKPATIGTQVAQVVFDGISQRSG